jgi:cell division protein FtsI/penicillin-binding protein 2
VGSSRFLALILMVVLGAAALLLRLGQLQLRERSVWAAEAAELVRRGEIIPFERGKILDRTGAPVAFDERAYQVELNYRDFRRGHPLAQVAHAWTALLGRTQSLAETLQDLDARAQALVELTPQELEDFARGLPLRRPRLEVEAANSEGERAARAQRARDVGFYIGRLLGLTSRENSRLRRLPRGENDRYVDLAARLPSVAGRGLGSPDLLQADLRSRVSQSRADLEFLARALLRVGAMGAAAEAWAASAPHSGLSAALGRLIERLENARAQVEDGAARDLFLLAAGFPAGRLDSAALRSRIDCTWLAELFCWDDARTLAWMERARADWLRGLERLSVRELALEVLIERDEQAGLPAEGLREAWSRPFRASVPGKAERFPLQVASSLESAFDLEPLERESPPACVLSLEAFEREEPAAADPPRASWHPERQLAWLEAWEVGQGDPDPAVLQALEREWLAFRDGDPTKRSSPYDRRWLEQRTRGFFERAEGHFQSAMAQLLAEHCARAGLDRLRPSSARLDDARERALYAQKDHASRALVLAVRPDYDLVYLLSRYHKRFAGLSVRERTERRRAQVAQAGREPRTPFFGLIGSVRPPMLEQVVLERTRRAEFEALLGKSERSPEEDSTLYFLASRVDLRGAPRGLEGIEGSFDPWLRGHDGYREERGLQELIEKGLGLERSARDGQELVLTLDGTLEAVTREVLEQPASDPDPSRRDEAWLARPTGAIVLASVDGEVLAAVSYPDFDRNPEGSSSKHDLPLERTLRIPDFQPPGSLFKPFVAAWALDRLGLDPAQKAACAVSEGASWAGYGGVRCNTQWGHGHEVDLGFALQHSCNSYFAWLGQTRFDQAQLAALAAEFGFGAATGVRPAGSRSGLIEHTASDLFQRPLDERSRMRAANGLSVVQATPMQLARALCALASGKLPSMRLVRFIGGVEFAPPARELALSARSLELVRAGMTRVTQENGGTAFEALNERELGLRVAAKTGSADLESSGEDGGPVRKHAWFGGFFPAESPRYVLVVFLHDTRAGASKSAVWVARDWFLRPAVREWLQREGMLP